MTGTRLVGVDAARGVALLGMVAVHVLPATDADGGTSAAHLVASGRSAALFAVLAGVGLALARPTPAALLVRALAIGLVGLLLGTLETGVAVILAYYALLFVVAVPLLRLSARALAGLAGAAALVLPVVSQAVRPGLPGAAASSPTLTTLLEDPVGLLGTLLVNGYYPVLVWTTYLCAGMAVGRLLRSQDRRLPWALLGGGAALAVLAAAASALLLGPLGGLDALAATLPASADAEQVVAEHRYGSVPTTTAWWLAVDAPHSSTPPDLLHTTGTSLAVLGAALLAARPVPSLLAPLAAAGSMPLSLYSLHVAALVPLQDVEPQTSFVLQVVALLGLAVLWQRLVGRGPLEALLRLLTRPLRQPAPT